MKQFLIFIFFILFSGHLLSQKTAIWAISKDHKESYIFGTYHSNNKEVFKLSDSVYWALLQSKQIALETDLFSAVDIITPLKRQEIFYFDNDGKIYTKSKRASSTVYGNEDGMPQFIDGWFQVFCFNTGKKFIPLETIEDQLNIVEDFVVGTSIKESLMQSLYQKRDFQEINALMKSSLTVSGYRELITERNAQMAEKLDDIFQEDTTFCAVGCAHLLGEDGILQLLRKKGYQTRRMAFEMKNDSLKKLFYKKVNQGFMVNDSLLQISLVFPGKPYKIEKGDGYQWLYREFGQGNSYFMEYIPLEEKKDLQSVLKSRFELLKDKSLAYLRDSSNGMKGYVRDEVEGVCFIKAFETSLGVIVLGTTGGNKYMNSQRPHQFIVQELKFFGSAQ